MNQCANEKRQQVVIYDMNASSRFMLWESTEAPVLPQKKQPENDSATIMKRL